jgi:hypothetical protein
MRMFCRSRMLVKEDIGGVGDDPALAAGEGLAGVRKALENMPLPRRGGSHRLVKPERALVHQALE